MTVNLREMKQVGAKYREKRRGRRMNSRVQIKLEWESHDGKPHSLQTNTRIVNPYGCMVVLSESLELEQRLALTNLATQGSNAAVVVWKGNESPEGWEYGIELVAPDMDFWGLEL
ncbi:MAG TPA: hypothetical protein VMT75_02940 [Candidatus Saccharimonadales bacterium]|nr:hypothetical protein [Candidatus Saccharimonadales bacterium]